MNVDFIPDEGQVLAATGAAPSETPAPEEMDGSVSDALPTAGEEEPKNVDETVAAEQIPEVSSENLQAEENILQAEEALPAPSEEAEPETLAAEAPTEVREEEVLTEPASEAPAGAEVASQEAKISLVDKTLSELSSMFQSLLEDENRMKRSKEADAIKTAFFKRLIKERTEAGFEGEEFPTAESAQEIPVPQAEDESGKVNPFVAIEQGFKELYSKFKAERAEYNKQQDKERADNLVKKQAVIEDLKALVERQDDIKDTFPAFREIQSRWREIGPVPVQNYRDVNEHYQLYVEQFYDKVQINRDLRDLDFKKNLQVKTRFCEAAEKLAESDNVVEAFRELQKLHEQWKEYGPVSKEYRESIWDRFKAATAVINKKYQAHFEGLKEKQVENLAAKTALCERVEAIVATEQITSSAEWNKLSKEIEEIQKEWRTIGFATKKENQKIYDRFRAARDKFYDRKREFYSGFKDSMNDNMARKMAIIEEAEALKTSTEWKKATDRFIALQKQWKEIGAVPRKKSEQMWKRFRAACDEFFEAKEKNAKPENNFYGNLKAKKALIEEIKAYEIGSSDDAQALQDFQARWQEIGFVPFKEKENISQAYREALSEKFPGAVRGQRRTGGSRSSAPRRPLTEKERLVQQYTRLQQDIDTYENNIGFFAASKNSAPLIQQMQQRIEESKKELKELEEKIRKIEDDE